MDIISEAVKKGATKGKRKEKSKGKGKSDTGTGKKGWKYSPETHDEGAHSEYTSYTAQEKNLGTLIQKEEWGERRWQDNTRWEWGPYEHEYVAHSRKTERKQKKKTEHQVEDGRHMGVPKGSRGEVGVDY